MYAKTGIYENLYSEGTGGNKTNTLKRNPTELSGCMFKVFVVSKCSAGLFGIGNLCRVLFKSCNKDINPVISVIALYYLNDKQVNLPVALGL